MKVSVCIPTYEMAGRGGEFLKVSFLSLRMQTLKDFEVIISDHSKDDAIKNFCENELELNVKYFRNSEKRGSSSANANNALKNAIGEVIKILFQDDYLCNITALEQIYKSFINPEVNWLAVGTVHTSNMETFYNEMVPMYVSDIHLGNNTISSPSVIAIRNKEILLFDEKLSWLMDVEYYKRLYDTYGLPKIIKNTLVVNRLWDGQVSSSQITQELIDKEVRYVKKKYS